MTDALFEDVEDLEYENPEGWHTVEPEHITGKGRWEVHKTRVISNGTLFYRLRWSEGATEYQDNDGDNGMAIVQVYPHQIMTTVYKTEKPA